MCSRMDDTSQIDETFKSRDLDEFGNPESGPDWQDDHPYEADEIGQCIHCGYYGSYIHMNAEQRESR